MLDYVELFVVCCKRDVLDRFFSKTCCSPTHAANMPHGLSCPRCQPNVVMYDMPEDKLRYGHDPREGLSRDSYTPDAEWSPTKGEVGKLTTINQLTAALDHASANNQVVSLKFIRQGCKACEGTAEAYVSTAAEYSDKGLFYTVDFGEGKEFVKTCQIRAVPCAHIYAGGKLRKATNLGPSKWDEFKADLDALRDELATGVLV